MDARALDGLYAEHVAALRVRLDAVLATEGWDAIAIHAGSLARRSRFDDQSWPLRVSPPFQHWLPLAEAECALVLRPGYRPTLLRPATTSFWEKPSPPESAAFEEFFDVLEVREIDAFVRAHLGPGRVAFVGEDPARAAAWGLDGTAACPPGLVLALERLRSTKTQYEVACLAEANRRAAAGHEALRQAFAAGDASELDLHLLFLKATLQDDSETPYKNIVALGAHAATLHHVAYARLTESRASESLLVDAGATCRGYGSDVTRTWVKGGGAAASTFAHLIASVEAMQRRLCASVGVGTPYESLHDESHRQMGAILRDVGLIRGSAEEAVAAGVTRAFFPHGLGHSLGLQTHDVGCALRAPRAENAFLRNTSDVAVGQVFTIEPGVYFIDELLAELRAHRTAAALVEWKMVDAIAPLGGVRIEDDLHVEADAVRNLTREHLPLGGGRVS
ncbi:MAG: Xaa-Pro dipeptidase [Myxococcota bacterium]|nr:Xaa-Pro dipeptidase [Myxococcota bacterium]